MFYKRDFSMARKIQSKNHCHCVNIFITYNIENAYSFNGEKDLNEKKDIEKWSISDLFQRITLKQLVKFIGVIISIAIVSVGVGYKFGEYRSEIQYERKLNENNIAWQNKLRELQTNQSILSEKLTYKPFSPNKVESVQLSLKKLKTRNTALLVQIGVQLGIKARILVGRELEDLFLSAGFKGTFLERYGDAEDKPNISIEYNIHDQKYALELRQILNVLFQEKIVMIESSSLKKGEIIIFLIGDPMFDNDGSVSFRS